MIKNPYIKASFWLLLAIAAMSVAVIGCEDLLGGLVGGGVVPVITSITITIGGKEIDIEEDEIYGGQLLKIEVDADDETISSLTYTWRVIRTTDLTDVTDDVTTGQLNNAITITIPEVEESTEFEIEVSVSDGENEVDGSITITISPNKASITFTPSVLTFAENEIGLTRSVTARSTNQEGEADEIDLASIKSNDETVAKVASTSEQDDKSVKIFIEAIGKGTTNVEITTLSDAKGELLVTVGEAALSLVDTKDASKIIGLGTEASVRVNAIDSNGLVDSVTVTSSDATVASADVTGSDPINKIHTITITGNSAGTTTITITSLSGRTVEVSVIVTADVTPTPTPTLTPTPTPRPDGEPPYIVHTPITSATEGDVINVAATITDNSGVVASAKLYYKISTDPITAYATESMASGSDTYTAQILADAVTTAGVDYYIEAKDALGNTAYDPIETPATTPHTIPVFKTAAVTNIIINLPTPASVFTTGQLPFTAEVKGDGLFDATVNWSTQTDGIKGTVTPNITFVPTPSLTYLPPTSGATGADTIIATSAADSSKTASATITVEESTSTLSSINVVPASASVTTGDPVTLTATVTGTGTLTISWKVIPGDGTGGTLSDDTGTSVTYTAPSNGGIYTVEVTTLEVSSPTAVAMITVTEPPPPPAQWSLAGGKLNTTSGSAWTLQPILASGSVFVLYTDPGYTNSTYVKKWNATTSMWEQLGGAVGSNLSYPPRLAVDGSGRPYVAYASGNYIYVYRYEFGSWNSLGGSYYAPYSPYDLSLDVTNSGIPYIAYRYYSAGDFIQVIYLSGGYFNNLGGTLSGSSPSFVIASDGTLYLAYSSGSYTYVYSWNAPGFYWQLVSSIYLLNVYSPILAVSNPTPYIAYSQDGNIRVQRQDGAYFQQLGTNLNTNPNSWTKPAIAIDGSGNPYVAFINGDTMTGELLVKRWDSVSNSWVQVGTKVNSTNTAGENMSIAFDGTIPFVAYSEETGPLTYNYDAYVKQFK